MNYDVGVITSRLLISPEPSFGVPTAVAAGAWSDLYSQTLDADISSFTNFTDRQVVAAAAYAGGAPATGSQLRVTIESGSLVGLDWSKVYIGHAAAAGDAYDFDGTQVQLLFSGSPSFSLAAATQKVSDAVTYSFNKTKALVISIYIVGPNDSLRQLVSSADFTNGFKSGDDAITTDATGYSVTASRIRGFPKVEVFG